MLKELIMSTVVMGSPIELSGYWENSQHAVRITVDSYRPSMGEIIWYTTGYTVGEVVWYNGELYYSHAVDAYCADLYLGNTLLPTVLTPVPPLGTICMDVVDDTLLVGYSVQMKDFGGCILRSFQLFSDSNCSGSLDLITKE